MEDGAPAPKITMKKVTIVLAVMLSCVSFGAGQAVPSGQLSFNALNGPFGSAGVDIYGTYGVSTYGQLREDNFLFPAANGSFYGGSYQYSLDRFTCPLLTNTNVSCAKFGTYVNAGLGVGRTTIASSATNHIGGGFGAGIIYDPSGQGKYSVTLLDVHEERLAFDTVKGWTTIASVGINLGFGNNQLATEAKIERVRAQQAKKLKKMQERARKADKARG